VGIIGAGAVACAGLVYTKPGPSKRANLERIHEVTVLPVLARGEQTPIIGHGTVRPKHQVNIVPQVSGRLTQVHPDLAQGKVIPKGELLFEVDPTVYEARVRQSEAEVRALEAALARHDDESDNLDARIANAEAMLAIDEEDHRTVKQLYEVEKVGTQRDVDLAKQKYLRQKGAVVELTSQRAVIPHVRAETQAQLDATKARLRLAQHDLENTQIRCPFEARVESVQAYKAQVVTAHFTIATLTDMEAFEISVGIDPRELRWLAESVRPEALNSAENGDSPAVHVKWSLHGQEFSWTGRVTRFERVDEATRTARMVVEVRQLDMVATLTAGGGESRPTLSIGMYCRTELPAKPLEEALFVPRHAIYENRYVYVFEPDSAGGGVGRLARREVPILRTVQDFVLVDYHGRDPGQTCELAPGERVVVSSLTKPVIGMKIRLRDVELTSTHTPPSPSPARPRQDVLAVVAAVSSLTR
jgi:multidrug efflux pump subunit AcrA (membrane-fusion protein)